MKTKHNKTLKSNPSNLKGKKGAFKLFGFVSRVLLWLCLSSNAKPSVPIQALELLCNHLSNIEDTRGRDFLIKYCKGVRGDLMNYLSGNPLRSGVAKCTGDGIPIILGTLIPLIRSRSYRVIAMVFTVLFSTRALSIGRTPNLETITQPNNGDVPDLSKYMKDFWKELGYRPAVDRKPKVLNCNLKDYRVTNGPNGHALGSALLDAKALPASLVKELGVLAGPRLENLIASYYSHPIVLRFFMSLDIVKAKIKDRGSFRRLSCFPDKENKVRTVGILDYFSQLALKPLHIYLSRALGKIRQDCTLDQGKFQKLLLNNPNIDKYYSVDLSAATDRFPIQVIKQLLKAQLPGPYVDAWEKVMVGYPFDFENNVIHYAVGNPMGAYSSFNSFALTHHYIIYYCCRELGKSWKRLPYALLGDDIVIGDSKVGELYKEIILSLGVEFAPAKTHESENFFEFAKRMFLDGVEISPFPVSALKESKKSFTMMTTVLLDMTRKGWVFDNLPFSVASFFGVVMDRNSSFQKKVEERSWQFKGVLETVQGTRPANEFINELIRKLELPLPELSEEICKNLYANAAVEAFASSNLLSQFSIGKLSLPLTMVGQGLYRKWNEFKRHNKDAATSMDLRGFFPTELPIAFAALAVQEDFNRLEERLRHIDSTGQDWSYYMRQFCLPKSDNALLAKENFATSRSTNHFYKLLEERLRILVEYPQLLNF